MRLIDADVLKADLKEVRLSPWYNNNTNGARIVREDALGIVEHFIDETPTIDLIYCKDCEHYAGKGRYCAWDVQTGDTGYCHHALPKGEREVTSEAD